jgi:hypothetical protein
VYFTRRPRPECPQNVSPLAHGPVRVCVEFNDVRRPRCRSCHPGTTVRSLTVLQTSVDRWQTPRSSSCCTRTSWPAAARRTRAACSTTFCSRKTTPCAAHGAPLPPPSVLLHHPLSASSVQRVSNYIPPPPSPLPLLLRDARPPAEAVQNDRGLGNAKRSRCARRCETAVTSATFLCNTAICQDRLGTQNRKVEEQEAFPETQGPTAQRPGWRRSRRCKPRLSSRTADRPPATSTSATLTSSEEDVYCIYCLWARAATIMRSCLIAAAYS